MNTPQGKDDAVAQSGLNAGLGYEEQIKSLPKNPYFWNGEHWVFYEPAWGGVMILRVGPKSTSRPMTIGEGIWHINWMYGNRMTPNVQIEALPASGQSLSNAGLGVAVPPPPIFDQGDKT